MQKKQAKAAKKSKTRKRTSKQLLYYINLTKRGKIWYYFDSVKNAKTQSEIFIQGDFYYA